MSDLVFALGSFLLLLQRIWRVTSENQSGYSLVEDLGFTNWAKARKASLLGVLHPLGQTIVMIDVFFVACKRYDLARDDELFCADHALLDIEVAVLWGASFGLEGFIDDLRSLHLNVLVKQLLFHNRALLQTLTVFKGYLVVLQSFFLQLVFVFCLEGFNIVALVFGVDNISFIVGAEDMAVELLFVFSPKDLDEIHVLTLLMEVFALGNFVERYWIALPDQDIYEDSNRNKDEIAEGEQVMVKHLRVAKAQQFFSLLCGLKLGDLLHI